MKIGTIAWLLTVLVTQLTHQILARKPHIVFILADDYGWNDIGYHNKKMQLV